VKHTKDEVLLLEAYTRWLLDHGYCDDDVFCEAPPAVERFLAEREEEGK